MSGLAVSRVRRGTVERGRIRPSRGAAPALVVLLTLTGCGSSAKRAGISTSSAAPTGQTSTFAPNATSDAPAATSPPVADARPGSLLPGYGSSSFQCPFTAEQVTLWVGQPAVANPGITGSTSQCGYLNADNQDANNITFTANANIQGGDVLAALRKQDESLASTAGCEISTYPPLGGTAIHGVCVKSGTTAHSVEFYDPDAAGTWGITVTYLPAANSTPSSAELEAILHKLIFGS